MPNHRGHKPFLSTRHAPIRESHGRASSSFCWPGPGQVAVLGVGIQRIPMCSPVGSDKTRPGPGGRPPGRGGEGGVPWPSANPGVGPGGGQGNTQPVGCWGANGRHHRVAGLLMRDPRTDAGERSRFSSAAAAAPLCCPPQPPGRIRRVGSQRPRQGARCCRVHLAPGRCLRAGPCAWSSRRRAAVGGAGAPSARWAAQNAVPSWHLWSCRPRSRRRSPRQPACSVYTSMYNTHEQGRLGGGDVEGKAEASVSSSRVPEMTTQTPPQKVGWLRSNCYLFAAAAAAAAFFFCTYSCHFYPLFCFRRIARRLSCPVSTHFPPSLLFFFGPSHHIARHGCCSRDASSDKICSCFGQGAGVLLDGAVARQDDRVSRGL